MSPALVRHGWEIAFQPQLFARRYVEMKDEVKRLQQELDHQSYGRHPRVKLLAAVMEGSQRQRRGVPADGEPGRSARRLGKPAS